MGSGFMGRYTPGRHWATTPLTYLRSRVGVRVHQLSHPTPNQQTSILPARLQGMAWVRVAVHEDRVWRPTDPTLEGRFHAVRCGDQTGGVR